MELRSIRRQLGRLLSKRSVDALDEHDQAQYEDLADRELRLLDELVGHAGDVACTHAALAGGSRPAVAIDAPRPRPGPISRSPGSG